MIGIVYVCMSYMCVVHACESANMHTHACVCGGQRRTFGDFVYGSSPNCLETRWLTELESHYLGRLAGQSSPSPYPVCSPQLQVTGSTAKPILSRGH